MILFASILLAVSPVLGWFEDNVYGHLPPKPAKVEFNCFEKGEAFGGMAERRQFEIVSTDAKGQHRFDVLVYLPRERNGKVAAFCYPNFTGSYTLVDDEAVKVERGHVYGAKAQRKRGARKDRAPVEEILRRGYAFVTWCYGAVYPDYTPSKRDAAPDSCYAIFPAEKLTRPLLAHPAWAWGAMRVRDLVETLPEVDQTKVAIVGHSRMGKNAIVVGVYDDRFSLVIANGGGVKSIKHLPNLKYPFWFAPQMTNYVNIGITGQAPEQIREIARTMPNPPYDQADFMALIAPRTLLVRAGEGDAYSPAALVRETVEKAKPLFAQRGGSLVYSERPGIHAITHEDWKVFLDLKGKWK